MKRFFHGTRHAESILEQGFDLGAQRRTDPGDLGWGIYLTDTPARARAHGEALAVVVDDSRFARIKNPYFEENLKRVEPETDVEALFYDNAFDENGEMVTVRGEWEERVAASKAVRAAFLRAGYQGIISGPDRRGQHEVVVFDPDSIHSIDRWHVFGGAPMSENPSDSPLLKTIAEKLYAIGRELFTRGTVKDAVVWESPYGLRAGWVMDARRMRNAGIDHEGHVPFSGAYAAQVLNRHGLRGETLKYEREMVMGDFLPRISNDLYDVSEEEPVTVTVIPEPGYPWPAPGGYYSAKLGRMVRSDRPGWLYPENIVDEGHNVDSPGINLCKMFDEPLDYEMGAEVGRYGTKPDDFFIVTHAMGTIEGMTRFGTVEGVAGWEENAQKVMECGGLLFPSMAIGPIPATNFGVGVLVADLGVVLKSLKPYLKRGEAPPSAVYSSDAWSGRTGNFLADSAVAAFEQMHGLSDYVYYSDQNIWPLGAPRAWAIAGPGSLAEELYKVTTLKKELKERFRVWTRGRTPEEVEEIIEAVALTKARYGYMEAKVNGIMRMSEFPMAAIPPQQEEGFRRFLDMTGFEGELLVVELPDELLQVMRPDWSPPGIDFDKRQAIQTWANMEYGWHVGDAIREHGRELKL